MEARSQRQSVFIGATDQRNGSTRRSIQSWRPDLWLGVAKTHHSRLFQRSLGMWVLVNLSYQELNWGWRMADKRSLMAGLAIGAGLALGIREGIELIMRRRGRSLWDNWHGGLHDHPERFRTTHAVLEPEDSRTESHVPNGMLEDDSWLERDRKPARARTRFSVLRNAKLEGQRAARNARRVANERDPYRPVVEPGAEAGEVNGGSRTTTSTEAELRRNGTDDNPVRYTRPTEPQAASGGEAPFIKREK